jgi:hypothetical protein
MAKSRAQQAAIAVSMKKAGKKPKSLPKAQNGKYVPGGRLTQKELSALAHQRRGMSPLDDKGDFFVKESGPIKNKLGFLNPAQVKQLKEYMNKSSTSEKIYQALPNVGRMFGKSAADIPKHSKLKYQKKGGIVTKKKR